MPRLKFFFLGWSESYVFQTNDGEISLSQQGMDVYVTQILAELYYLIDEEGGIPSSKRAAALLGRQGFLKRCSAYSPRDHLRIGQILCKIDVLMLRAFRFWHFPTEIDKGPTYSDIPAIVPILERHRVSIALIAQPFIEQ